MVVEIRIQKSGVYALIVVIIFVQIVDNYVEKQLFRVCTRQIVIKLVYFIEKKMLFT